MCNGEKGRKMLQELFTVTLFYFPAERKKYLLRIKSEYYPVLSKNNSEIA
jgi:hypothetical protein